MSIIISPFVSVIMPVHNESAHITQTLSAVLAQDYPTDKMEILIADGMSSDDTRAKIGALRGSFPVIVLENPGRIVPTGLNLALQRAKGEVIVRVDGHTVIAPDYVRQCVEALRRSGAQNVGGRMNAQGQGAFGQVVALATSTPFGVGGARFHYSEAEEWVDTVYMGAWPRTVFEQIGLFDEELVRDQDDEFNYRLREHGGRILLSPFIRSEYTVRSTPRALWRQYYQYGLWKIRVLQKHPRQMRPRQFIPPAFALSLIASLVLALFFILHPSSFILLPLSFMLFSYISTNIFASLLSVLRSPNSQLPNYLVAFVLLPWVFAILHLSYGLGFLAGLLKFANRWRDKQGRTPRSRAAMPEHPDLVRLRAEYAERAANVDKSERYSLFNPAQLFAVQQRQRAILKCLRRNGFYPLKGRRILELGCGSGGVLLEALSFGAAAERVHGADLLLERVQAAGRTLPSVALSCADGQRLPYASASFDLTMQFTVFSSVLDDEVKTNMARELLRVTRPGGMILWYDFWLNPSNPQTRGIRPAEIRHLFPGCRYQFERITLAPPLARRLVPVSWGLSLLLEGVKIFNTHYLVAIRM